MAYFDAVRYARKLRAMIRFADELRDLATDPTIKFGCVIFPTDCSSVLGIGYNGAPAGMAHTRPDIPLDTPGGSGICHAELNALTKMNTVSAPPCILFVHRTPCMRCAGQIINARKIIGVIHEDPYIDEGAGRDYIKTAGIWTVHRAQIESIAEGNLSPVTEAILKGWKNV